MKTIQVLLIDDEISALNTLRGMLHQYCPQVTILGEAGAIGEAVQKIRIHKPDLLFLDIEMPPHGTAFDLLKQLQDQKFGVIFTTAYPQYAIDAINIVQPWSYLIKPYSVKSLQNALEIAAQKLEEVAQTTEKPTEPNAILIQDPRKGNVVVRFHEILFCQSDSSIVEIFIYKYGKTEQLSTYKTMRELEQELPERFFFRTHHSYIVNLAQIDRLERTGRNGILHLSNGMRVAVSVQKMAEFEQRFEQFLNPGSNGPI